MYHNFFIHSSVDGHLGSFHVLAIVNRDTMNNGIHVSFSIFVSSGYMLGLGLLGHKSLQMVTAAMKLKDAYSLEGKL